MNKNCFREISLPVFVAVTIPSISSFSFPPHRWLRMRTHHEPLDVSKPGLFVDGVLQCSTVLLRIKSTHKARIMIPNWIWLVTIPYDRSSWLIHRKHFKSLKIQAPSQSTQGKQHFRNDHQRWLNHDWISFGEFFTSARFLFSVFPRIELLRRSVKENTQNDDIIHFSSPSSLIRNECTHLEYAKSWHDVSRTSVDW